MAPARNDTRVGHVAISRGSDSETVRSIGGTGNHTEAVIKQRQIRGARLRWGKEGIWRPSIVFKGVFKDFVSLSREKIKS